MERPVDCFDARKLAFGVKLLIAGDQRQFAHCRDGIGGVGRAVAIIDEPRITLQHEGGAEKVSGSPGDRFGADIPGDVPRELRLGEAKRAERLRNAPSGMLAHQHEWRIALRIHHYDRIVFPLEETPAHAPKTPLPTLWRRV